MTLRARCSRAVVLLVLVALSIIPATLHAQRLTSIRAGIAAPRVDFATPAHVDTARADSIAPHRSRAVDATVGGLVGTIAGGLAGAIYAQQGAKHCGDGPCMVGLAVPFFAGIGLVVGAVAGAMWRTH